MCFVSCSFNSHSDARSIPSATPTRDDATVARDDAPEDAGVAKASASSPGLRRLHDAVSRVSRATSHFLTNPDSVYSGCAVQ